VHFQAPAESAGFCDTSSIDQVLMHLCTQLADLLFARGQAASELSLDITTRAGIECVHKSLKHPTMQKENLLRLARQMYAQTKPQTIVLAVALSSDNLVVPPFTQGDIFTDNAGVADGIVRAMQSAHSRFGSHAVQKAGQLPHTRRELVRMLWEGNNL
jgi:hypothetical protein